MQPSQSLKKIKNKKDCRSMDVQYVVCDVGLSWEQLFIIGHHRPHVKKNHLNSGR